MMATETVEELGLNNTPKVMSIHVDIKNNSSPSEFPLQCIPRDFALTKNGSKTIRLGLDAANEFSPYVMFFGETNKNGNRIYHRLSPAELNVLMSREVQMHVLNALENRTTLEPLSFGEITLSINKEDNKKFVTVCVEKKDSPIKIYLALSSWKMIFTLKENMEYHLMNLTEMAILAKSNWSHLISHCQDYCVKSGYKNPQSIVEMSRDHADNLMASALRCYLASFPVSVRLDLQAYHKDFIKEAIYESTRQA